MVLYMILTSYYTLKVAISVRKKIQDILYYPDNLSLINSKNCEKNWSSSNTPKPILVNSNQTVVKLLRLKNCSTFLQNSKYMRICNVLMY